MSVAFIISSVQALIFAYLTFNKKNKGIADNIFFTLMLILGIHLTGAYFISIHPDQSTPYLLSDAGTMILYPAMIFLYVQALISNAGSLTFKHAFHILPVMILYAFILPVRDEIIDAKEPTGYPIALYLALIWGLIVNIFYIACILSLLKKHNLNIRQHYSYSERIDLKWVRGLVAGYVLVFIATLILSVFFNANQIDIRNSNQIIYYLLCTFVFYVGYQGYRQQTFVPAMPIADIDEKEVKTNEDAGNALFIAGLKQFMHEHKPFLNPTLTLGQLAEQLNVPSYYLSQILNTVLKCNFFDFVNHYRVEEFKKNLESKTNTHYTLLALALEAGFNSKASFNRIFKNITGLTPSQYYKSVR